MNIIDLPPRFQHVPYSGSRIPGCDDASNLLKGANCQLFAYEYLREQGYLVPDLRSSDMWEDRQYTQPATSLQPNDLVMYNKEHNAFGAHVGVYLGNDLVLHLSLNNRQPCIENHQDLLRQQKYRFFIGGKRFNKALS